MRRYVPGLAILLLLMVPGLLWMAGFNSSTTENRNPSPWPAPSTEAFWSGDYWDDMEAAVIDRTPLRAEATELNAELLLGALNEPAHPDVVLGHREWLFFAPAVGQPCATFGVEYIASMERAARLAKYAGKELYVLIAPDKPAVFPELLPASSCAEATSRSLNAATARLPDVAYPLEYLLHLKSDRTSTDPIYYTWDTHWTTGGAAAASRAVIDLIDDSLWNHEDLEVVAYREHAGDLAGFLGIDRPQRVPEYAIVRSGVKTSQTNAELLQTPDGTPIPKASGLRFSSSSADRPLLDGETVFLHDSFGWAMIPTLSPYFKSLTTTRYNDIDDASAPRVRSADRLIIEYVQRTYSGHTTLRPLDEQLTAVLQDELPEVPFRVARTDDGSAEITIDSTAACLNPLSYLILARNGISGAVEGSINGLPLAPQPNSSYVAVWSADGRWTLHGDGLDQSTARAIQLCESE